MGTYEVHPYDPPLTPDLSRCPIIEAYNGDGISDTSPPLQYRRCLRITTESGTNRRNISFLQTEEEDSIMTSHSTETLIDEVRALMLDSARFQVRAEHLQLLHRQQLLTPWTTGVAPYPPFIQANPRLLAKIRETRLEAAKKIQLLAVGEFERQSCKLGREGDTLLTTLEAMMEGKTTPSLEERLTQTAAYVGRSKANLQNKMEERRLFLAKRQPTAKDWDDYFHYAIAFRRTQDFKQEPINAAFTVTASDRAQVDRDISREIDTALAEDADDEGPDQPQQKRKRRDNQLTQRQGDSYKIPKKGQNRRSRNERRDNTPWRSQEKEGDFGRSRPPQDRQPAVYYNSDYRRGGNRDGRDDSSTERRDRRGHNQRGNLTDRDRKLLDLQRELDRLKRN